MSAVGLQAMDDPVHDAGEAVGVLAAEAVRDEQDVGHAVGLHDAGPRAADDDVAVGRAAPAPTSGGSGATP